MRRVKLVVLIVILAVVLTFVPFVPAGGPCPWGAQCFNLSAAAANGQYGSVSYVLVGFGANGAYPIKDLHNESGHYFPVDNYFEGNYGFSACNKGEEWALLYGGPWGCSIWFDFYWKL